MTLVTIQATSNETTRAKTTANGRKATPGTVWRHPLLPLGAGLIGLLLSACGSEVGEPVDATALEPDVVAVDQVAVDDTGLAPGSDLSVEDPMPEVADMADSAAGGWQALQADWASAVPDVKARFGELSEAELLATEGDRAQLVALVQEKYQLDAAEADRQVSDLETMM